MTAHSLGNEREVGTNDDLGLLTVLDALAITGVRFDLDLDAGHGLCFDPPLLPDAMALVEPHLVLLTWVAYGRYTGHAPAVCDQCGSVSMVSVVNSSGTARGKPSVGWPRCLDSRCKGRRVVREADRFGVARVKYRGVPRPPKVRRGGWAAQQGGGGGGASQE